MTSIHERPHTYFYSEGDMDFPDLQENPSMTILTGESGAGSLCFKRIVWCERGRYRRFVSDELEHL